ncbi:hypothetical protein ACWDTT_10595 [Streptosporangium sandarakinum]
MADLSVLITRVRNALGDLGEPFRTTLPGGRDRYEVGYQRVTDVTVAVVEGSTVSDLPEDSYVLDAAEGVLQLAEPVAANASLLVTGRAFSLFTDGEISEYIGDAVRRHTYERETTARTRDANGFIQYVRTPITLATLPEVELEPLTILATIVALWDMATDAASDVDVVTAEGTHLARGQRYAQLMDHINALQARYNTICQQLNIGMSRIEVGTLRRVSRTTGRLVPVFAPREYDEYSPNGPRRLLPPIDSPHEDESGIPSPHWGGWGN